MPAELILQQTPDTATLMRRRGELAAARARLAEREAEFAQTGAQLKIFEGRYLREIGTLYAELDELEARIAEREVDLYDSDAARRRASEARRRAQETFEAAASADLEPDEFEPPPSLKTLFREFAKRIHPDFASDEAEREHLTLMMMRANLAYSRGDADTLQRMLDDQRELGLADEGIAFELLRLLRQIEHCARDVAAIGEEEAKVMGSEIGLLFLDAEVAAIDERDLLAELGVTLRQQIADARYRFDFVDRQISANER